MFEVTEAALNRLSEKLSCRQAEAERAFRFIPLKGGWKLSLDSVHADDKAYKHAGKDVLLMNPAATDAMAALVLDVRRTKKGARLTLQRKTPRGT